MPIYAFEEKIPSIDDGAYVAPTAIVIGDVVIGKYCYIGHGAIIRGDYGAIVIGEASAIEEGAIIHARPGDQTIIGDRVTVGHGAMIHNASIRDGATIGMRAVISDFSEVGEGALIGEQALVPRGKKIPQGVIAVGVPVQIVGMVGSDQADMMVWAKTLYKDLAKRYPSALREVSRDDTRTPNLCSTENQESGGLA